MNSRRWSNVTKIIVSATLALLGIVLLVTFRAMITPTIVAFLLAFILGYPVNWIQRRTGWSRGVTVALIYLLLGTLAVIMPVLIFPRSAGLVTSLQDTLQNLVSDLQSAQAGPIFSLGPYQLSADSLFQEAGNALQNLLLATTGNAVYIFRGVTTGVLTVVYVLVVNFWLLKDLQKLQRLIIEQIPRDYQEEVRHLGGEIGQIWHAFLRGQVVLGIVVGLLTWLALAIVGMPNAGGLALLAGFMELLPAVGPGISATIGSLVALFQGSTWLFPNSSNIPFALVVVTIYAIIAQIESVYLIPRLVGSRVRLHPAVTFIGIINGAIVFGVLGVLLATPVIASTRTILAYIFAKLFDQTPFEQEGPSPSGIRIRGLIAGRKIEGIIFDLEGTLVQLDWSMVDWVARRTRWMEWLIPDDQRRRLTRRTMIGLEGTVNFIINQLWRMERFPTLERMQPLFDRIRGYPAPQHAHLLPDAYETLQQLQRNYRLALVSTRTRDMVDSMLASTQLDPHIFDVIISREDVRNLLPHSEAMLAVAERLSLDPNQVLIVSDTDVSLRSGGAAEMATVGVLTGLARGHDLQSADLVVSTTAELTDWL